MVELDSKISKSSEASCLVRVSAMDRSMTSVTLALEKWEQVSDALTIVTDETGRILHINRNSLAYLGIESERLNGTLLQNLEFEDTGHPLTGRISELLSKIKSQGSVDSYSLPLTTCDGNECELIFHGLSIIDDANDGQQILLVGHVSTNRVNRYHNNASETLAELHKVTSQSAHRFNNLLTALGCQIDALHDLDSKSEDLNNIQSELRAVYLEFKAQSHKLSQNCANLKPVHR